VVHGALPGSPGKEKGHPGRDRTHVPELPEMAVDEAQACI